MAVRSVAIWQPSPGKAGAFLAICTQAKAIHERLGGKVRVSQLTFAGPNAGQIVYSIEHADMTALAKFGEKLSADTAWQTLWSGSQTADPAATLQSHSVLGDVPGF